MSAPIDPRSLPQVLGQFCTGITIITTVHDDVPIGFACQSFAALSLDPPLVLFCPTKVSRSWKAIEASGRFCVNVLTEKQKHVSARFGSKEPDKFAGIDWHPSELGSPIIDGSLAYIDCTVASVHDGGDHFVVFGAVAIAVGGAQDQAAAAAVLSRRLHRHRTGQDHAGPVARRPGGVPHHDHPGHLALTRLPLMFGIRLMRKCIVECKAVGENSFTYGLLYAREQQIARHCRPKAKDLR